MQEQCSSPPTQLSSLPNELWLDIFHRVSQNKPFLPSSQNGAFMLSRVCRRWRVLVISERKFWTTLHLFNNRVEVGKRQRQERLVDLCLQRSDPCKLDIILTDLQRYRRAENVLTLPISFLNQTDRWRTLRLEIVMSPSAFRRFSVLKGQLQQLESFTVVYKPLKRPLLAQFTSMRLHFLENAPQLQTLRLMDPIHLLSAMVSFKRLTQVDLVPVTKSFQYPSTIHQFLNILERCPNLSRCRLVCNISDNDEQPFLSVVPRPHPNILNLDIFVAHSSHPDFGQPLDGRTVFDFLDLPSLAALSITSYEPELIWNVDSLDSFLVRTRGGLLRLELHFPRQPNKSMMKHLKHLRLTPKLQHLFILIVDMGYSEHHILHDLSNDDGSLAWPPALHRLYYWTMNHNSTFAISSTPYWKYPSDSPYLQRSTQVT